MRILSLALFLCSFWLASSGRTEALFLGAMLASCAAVVWLAARMRIVDAEGHSVQILPRLPGFAVWLVAQIVRSNLTVARAVLAPRLAVAPRVLREPATQQHDLGRAVLANCVTLTPGTVTLGVEGDAVLVHVLSADSATPARLAEMDRRVRSLTGQGS